VVFFEHTALGLRVQGFDVSFILINCTTAHLATFLTTEKFIVHHLQVNRILFSWRQIMQCARILKSIKPNAVHSHMAVANWVGLWAARIANVPMRVFTRHSGYPLYPTLKETIVDKIQNKLATHIVAITQNVSNLLQAQNVPAHKIILIHHGFDIARMMHPIPTEVAAIQQKYNPTNNYPVIGVVARWIELKGIQYIIPAFKQLLVDYPNAKLCLFNSNDSEGYGVELKKLCATIPTENINCIGVEDNVYALYKLCDVYVHVPINEGCEAFGQTYVEALAAGIPSVFTLSGVAPEFIRDKKNALVVGFKNSEDIYNAIKTILTSPELKNELIAQGQKDVIEKFSVQQYINKLATLYTH
ncbi:MAG: glycosyltransferase family 4 protein, partial [Bacteroidia bacterium]